MKYEENGKTYTSSNHPSWFSVIRLQGYKVPVTHYEQINCSHPDEQENKDPKITSHTKGFKFDKKQRPDFLIDKKNVPAPNYYLKQQNSAFSLGNKHQSRFFKKYPRFQTNSSQDKKQQPYFFFQENIEQRKHRTFSKAELVGFIDSALFKGEKTPGPGEYYSKITRHKSLSIFSKGKKDSFLEKQKKQDKKVIGPQTYQISRSLSLFCSAKLHEPYKQKDEKMKQRISVMNEQKQKIIKVASRNYLKIQQWCKYSKDKKMIPNRFNACSKPQLRIYP